MAHLPKIDTSMDIYAKMVPSSHVGQTQHANSAILSVFDQNWTLGELLNKFRDLRCTIHEFRDLLDRLGQV